MNIFKKYGQIRPTGIEYPVQSMVEVGALEQDGSAVVKPHFGTAKQYEVRVTLSVGFACTQDHYDNALEHAVRSSAYELHKETIAGLDKIMAAAYRGDFREVIAKAQEIRKEILE